MQILTGELSVFMEASRRSRRVKDETSLYTLEGAAGKWSAARRSSGAVRALKQSEDKAARPPGAQASGQLTMDNDILKKTSGGVDPPTSWKRRAGCEANPSARDLPKLCAL